MSDEFRDVREIIREEMAQRIRIMNLLRANPRTVPEIAEAIGRPTREVMFWLMGMRKYGMVAEIGEVTDEGYYRYKATEKEGS
jgi:DNA-binding IclR family transcriptional regulator